MAALEFSGGHRPRLQVVVSALRADLEPEARRYSKRVFDMARVFGKDLLSLAVCTPDLGG